MHSVKRIFIEEKEKTNRSAERKLKDFAVGGSEGLEEEKTKAKFYLYLGHSRFFLTTDF